MGIGVALGTIGSSIAGAFGVSIATTSIAAGMIGGAVVGAVVGGLTSAVMGGSVAKGMLFGAIGGAVTGGLGAGLGGGGWVTGNAAEQAANAVGGTMAQGSYMGEFAGQTQAGMQAATTASTTANISGNVATTLEGIGAQMGMEALKQGAQAYMASSAQESQQKYQDEQAALAHQRDLEKMEKQAELTMMVNESKGGSGGGTDNTAAILAHEARMAELDQRRHEFATQTAQVRREWDASQDVLEARRGQFGRGTRMGGLDTATAQTGPGLMETLQGRQVKGVGDTYMPGQGTALLEAGEEQTSVASAQRPSTQTSAQSALELEGLPTEPAKEEMAA